ncbi:MAG: hypothetical protein VW378_02870, partial [bacterium]
VDSVADQAPASAAPDAVDSVADQAPSSAVSLDESEDNPALKSSIIHDILASITTEPSSLPQDEDSQMFKSKFLEIYQDIERLENKETLNSDEKKRLKELKKEETRLYDQLHKN